MGVYVKDMVAPTGCLSCDFCNPFADEPYCRRLMRRAPKVTRLDDCPLVPVPPHGRLGDLDKIERYKERLVVDADKIKPGIRYVVDTKYIKEAPTIIPESEEE